MTGFLQYGAAAMITILAGRLAEAEALRLQNMDPRAAEAVGVFQAECIATGGDKQKALSILGIGIPGANRLPDDVLSAAEGGQKGGIGWVMKTPSNATFMLEYDPRGVCGVRLVEADEKSVQSAFALTAFQAARDAGATLARSRPRIRHENGARITFEDYTFVANGRTTHLSLSTSDHKVAAQQHFMTLAFNSSKE